jgi:hypothetical protein
MASATDALPGAERATVDAATARPYANPYLAGIGLGLVLLAAFVTMGRGLGASGASASVVAWALDALAPGYVAHNEYLAPYIGDRSTHPLKAWLVFEILGVVVGAFVSGVLAGRVRRVIEKGPRVSTRTRLLLAFAGGMLIAIGADLGRGCMSGQALTGGALLNAGSWALMMCIFAGAYAVAWLVRREWR